MSQARGFVGSTIGRKVVMAVTGAILFGFVLGHMVGNLQVYLGPEAINDYAVFLREVLHGTGLWIARVVLLVAVVLHIWAADVPDPDQPPRAPGGLPAGKVEGVDLRLAHDALERRHPAALRRLPPAALHVRQRCTRASSKATSTTTSSRASATSGFPLFYIVAMLALGLHLRHGVWSMLPDARRLASALHPDGRTAGAWIFAAIVVIGNISFPLAVLAGIVR